MMRARRIKRICSVRGCKNTDCYVIARFCEFTNSVIICKDCLKDALSAIDPSIFEVKTIEGPTAENIENAAEPIVENSAGEPIVENTAVEKSDTKSEAKPKRQTGRRTSKAKEE